MSDLKPVKVTGELFWSKWMKALNTKFNEANNKYECTIGKISDGDAAKLTALGIKVKNKGNEMGNFIVCKSTYPIKALDTSLNPLDSDEFGNGTKVTAVVSSYTHRMSAMHGNAPSLKNLMVTEVVTYTPPVDADAIA